jgi:hypothetical protein
LNEKNIALRDVYNVVRQYGSTVEILQQTEAQTERDDYGSIINRTATTITVNAFPVELDPSEKKLQALGINEQTNVLLHLSKLECDEMGITFDSINSIIHTFQWLGVEYKITSKRYFSQFNGEYLYIILGGIRN